MGDFFDLSWMTDEETALLAMEEAADRFYLSLASG